MSNLNIERKTNKSVFIFIAIATLTVFVVTLIYTLSKDRVTRNKEQHQTAVLESLLKSSKVKYDNDILKSVIFVKNTEFLHSENYSPIYIAKYKGNISAVIMQTIAPDGYNGNINIFVAVKPDLSNFKKSSILNIKITDHEETPGLGDKADADKYPDKAKEWLELFTGKSLNNPLDRKKWAVKKDYSDGIIDTWTGATITPRAITKAVYNSLIFFERYHKEIFNTKYNEKIKL